MTWKRDLLADDEPQLVSYGDLWIPARYTVEVEGDPLPYRVTLQVVCGHEGPAVAGLKIDQVEGGPPVTGEGLRSPGLSVSRLLRASVYLVADSDPDNPFAWASHEATAKAESEIKSTQRRWRLTDEHLAEVARVHEEASGYRLGGKVPAPTAAVAEHFNVSLATAKRWRKAAEEKGLLTEQQTAAQRRAIVRDLKKTDPKKSTTTTRRNPT